MLIFQFRVVVLCLRGLYGMTNKGPQLSGVVCLGRYASMLGCRYAATMWEPFGPLCNPLRHGKGGFGKCLAVISTS